MKETLQVCRQHNEEPAALFGDSFEVQRFTREDHAAGKTAGWRQWTAWDAPGAVTWAFFRREVDRGAP